MGAPRENMIRTAVVETWDNNGSYWVGSIKLDDNKETIGLPADAYSGEDLRHPQDEMRLLDLEIGRRVVVELDHRLMPGVRQVFRWWVSQEYDRLMDADEDLAAAETLQPATRGTAEGTPKRGPNDTWVA